MNSADIVFFFGAGGSAPFGIPTMKQFVIDFEKFLEENGTEKERKLYDNIKHILATRLRRNIDLEAIFTVIDGYVNFSFERLGLLSLYTFNEPLSQMAHIPSVTYEEDVEVCQNLRDKFQKFVRDKCLIPEESFPRIATVYHDFFNRFIAESSSRGGREGGRGDYWWHNNWTIFTTNYDTCLEHYWRQVAKATLNTGFSFDPATYRSVLRGSDRFYEGNFKLIKLHGSVSWFLESDGTIVEEQTVPNRSFVGREIVGETMIYPVQEKELYFEPYISMFVQLNQELRNKSTWVIVGYSFNDPTIREIFLRNSNEGKKIILVHPNAHQISTTRLDGLKGDVGLITEKFGLEHNFRLINHTIIKKLKPSPTYSYDKTPP